MLINRPFWQDLIESYWQLRSIVWLMGVRRTGKTSLCQSIPNIVYYDCELASVRRELVDYEQFLNNHQGKRIILDEIHRLDNPSEVLKVAADHYPTVKIIATGSSTLGASSKFRDTLTGRKLSIWLAPLFLDELQIFGNSALDHRLLVGGLPGFFANKKLMAADYAEWLEAYWAKDIQDMFKVGKRGSFLKFAELLFAQSGGIFEATKFAKDCEVSRLTIGNYLAVLEETLVFHIIKPYSTHKASEITKAPRVYAFDTGFACYIKNLQELQPSEAGLLWEHCVLNELHGKLQLPFNRIHYWRDKQGHEIDFVLREQGRENPVAAIECKLRSTSLNHSDVAVNFTAFRKNYPLGKNYVVTSDMQHPFVREHKDMVITYLNPHDLVNELRATL